MTGILVCIRFFTILILLSFWACSPTAEAEDLKSFQCGFETHQAHRTAGFLPFLLARCPQAPLAQLVEQWTFNPLVAGSRPAGGTMEEYTDLQKQLIQAIAVALEKDPQLCQYKLFKTYLKDTQQYWIKCILSDNRYLYGSFVKAARSLIPV